MPFLDPEAKRANDARWKRENKDAVKYSVAARHANQRAAEYGVPGILKTADVRVVLAGARCVYCGGHEQLGIDHRLPMHAGGPNTPENIQACCHSCNASKWRCDKPGRWSQTRDSCIDCGTTERKHLANGRCGRCDNRWRRRPEDAPEVLQTLRRKIPA